MTLEKKLDLAKDPTVRLTVDELRGILQQDPEGFFRIIDKIIDDSTCSAETRAFWSAVKEFARRSSKEAT